MKWRLTFVAIVALCYACVAWIPLQSEINKDNMGQQNPAVPVVKPVTPPKPPQTTLPQKGLNFQFYQNLTVPGGLGQLYNDKNLGIVFTFPVPPGVRDRKLYTYQNGFFAFGFAIIHLQKQGQDIMRLPLAIEDPVQAAGGSGENYNLSINSAEFQASIAPSINSQFPGSSVTALQKYVIGAAGQPDQYMAINVPNSDILIIKSPTPAYAGSTPLYTAGGGLATPFAFYTMSLLPYYIKNIDIDSVTLEVVSVTSFHAPPSQPNIQAFVGVYTE